MLETTREMLQKAYEGGYAVPAVNTQGGTYDIIRAVCQAAENLRSPIILAHYLATGQYSGHDWFAETARWLAAKVSVPVAIHLDHGDTFETCAQMLRYGFTSLMYDGSMLPVAENAARTAEVIRMAHAVGVPVEAEIGELARLDDAGNITGSSNMADPEAVREFLSLCAPDSLAISIGNAHGFYKGEPVIRVDILRQCRKFSKIPFVLHGCTGMNTDMIREAIGCGVAKINFGTQIRHNYVQYLKEGLEKGEDGGGHAWKLSRYACGRLTQDVEAIIRLAGSDGKA